jgi:hypothetical protein
LTWPSYSLLDPPVPSSVWTWNEGGQHLYFQSESALLPVAESGWGTDMQCMFFSVFFPSPSLLSRLLEVEHLQIVCLFAGIGVKVGPFDTSVFELVDAGCLTRQCPKSKELFVFKLDWLVLLSFHHSFLSHVHTDTMTCGIGETAPTSLLEMNLNNLEF